MLQIEAWKLIWDVDNRIGFIDVDPVGPPPPFRVGPLDAGDFAAASCVLAAARAAGGRPLWDQVNRAFIF